MDTIDAGDIERTLSRGIIGLIVLVAIAPLVLLAAWVHYIWTDSR